MYYPVAVEGGLFSVGDSHAAQGDSEICGTAIEMSLTGTLQLLLHKKNTSPGPWPHLTILSSRHKTNGCCTASASPTI